MLGKSVSISSDTRSEPGQASGWRRLSPWAFGLLTLFALVLVVLHFGTIEQFARLARAARPEWFFLVCVAQPATYVCASLVWREALRRAGHPRPLSTLIPLGIAKLFTDQVVPSDGVSGAILVARGLTRRASQPTYQAREIAGNATPEMMQVLIDLARDPNGFPRVRSVCAVAVLDRGGVRGFDFDPWDRRL